MTLGAHQVSATVPACHGTGCFLHFGCTVTKSLEVPKWHWFILAPMGALDHDKEYFP